jgi:hypothetical protein
MPSKSQIENTKVLMQTLYTKVMAVSARQGTQEQITRILERITDTAWSSMEMGADVYYEGQKVLVWGGMTKEELKLSINRTMFLQKFNQRL